MLVLIVAAVLLLSAGVAALVFSGVGRRTRASGPARASAAAVAEAPAQAAAIIAEARSAALRAREAALDELTRRRAAVESREAVLVERDQTLRERRRVFDDRRFAYKKRREEIEARRDAVAADESRISETVTTIAPLALDPARATVVERLDAELAAEHPSRVDTAVGDIVGDVDRSAAARIVEAIERQDGSNIDTAPRVMPLSLERLDEHARERLMNALRVIADDTGMELGVDNEKAQATLRGVDPVGREIARQAALEVVDRHVQAADVPPLLQRTR